jgi:hypothetical protein
MAGLGFDMIAAIDTAEAGDRISSMHLERSIRTWRQ